MAFVRVSRESRASRKRIQLLESDERSANWLSSVFNTLEKEVTDVVGDIVDNPADGDPIDPTAPSSALGRSEAQAQAEAKDVSQPIFTAAQKTMIGSLNALPNLKKKLAFIHPVRNSHAVVICRDEKKFESHKVGRGVLRHWRDNFTV